MAKKLVRRKPGPKRPYRLPECLNSPVPERARRTLLKHFQKIDPEHGIRSFHFLMYVWLTPHVNWTAENFDHISIYQNDILDIYGAGKNSMRVADAVADLIKFGIRLQTRRPNEKCRKLVVSDITAPIHIRNALQQLLTDRKSKQVIAATGEQWRFNSTPYTKAEILERQDKRDYLIRLLERDTAWHEKLKEHYSALLGKACQQYFHGDITLLGFRRNVAILKRIISSDKQRYSASNRSARIYGDGFNQLSRAVREELESLMGWTVIDLKACHLTIIAFSFGWKETISLLESQQGFWHELITPIEQLTERSKVPYKTFIQSLLFGRTPSYAKHVLALEVGHINANKFFSTNVVQEISSGVDQVLTKISAGEALPLPREQFIEWGKQSRKEAKSTFSLWAQQWEMYYISTITFEIETMQNGIVRAVLHDGVTIKTISRRRLRRKLKTILKRMNRESTIQMKLGIKNYQINKDI